MFEISVIIPVYNSKDKIDKIIGDLDEQTFRDFELIIVDDGSTDSTLSSINEKLKSTSISYKIISLSKNQGVSNARNLGLNEAKGKYIYFVDSDDRIERETLHELRKNMEETGADISICNYDVVDENKNVIFNSKNIDLKQQMVFDNHVFLKKVISNQYFVYVGSVLYKRSIIENRNIRFTKGAKSGEDREFLIKAIFYSHKVVLDKKVLFHYVQNELSATRKKKVSLDVFHNVSTFYRLAEYLKRQDASSDILNCIYEIRIPESIVDALIRLIISGYHKEKLNVVIKNKNIKKAIGKYKFSIKSRRDLKRSIKILLFRLWPGLFFLINKLRRI